jgi:hypothetical protein
LPKRLLQLLGDWLVKNIRVDLTQRFVAPRIRLGAPVGEPALCGFPRSRHQSDPPATLDPSDRQQPFSSIVA